MESWQQLLRKQSIASLEALVARFGAEHFPDLDRLRQAAENFEFRISPAMVDLIKSPGRSEEHTSELQSRLHLVCRLLLEKKKEHMNGHRSAVYHLSLRLKL